jgi:hypothetical protein
VAHRAHRLSIDAGRRGRSRTSRASASSNGGRGIFRSPARPRALRLLPPLRLAPDLQQEAVVRAARSCAGLVPARPEAAAVTNGVSRRGRRRHRRVGAGPALPRRTRGTRPEPPGGRPAEPPRGTRSCPAGGVSVPGLEYGGRDANAPCSTGRLAALAGRARVGQHGHVGGRQARHPRRRQSPSGCSHQAQAHRYVLLTRSKNETLPWAVPSTTRFL